MLGVPAKWTQRVSRESRTGSTSANACAKRARPGAIRAAQVWQMRRLAFRLSGARVVRSAGRRKDEVVRSDAGMAEAIKAWPRWAPMFRAATARGGVARTMSRLLRAYSDGVPALGDFNEARLAVLPKGSQSSGRQQRLRVCGCVCVPR